MPIVPTLPTREDVTPYPLVKTTGTGEEERALTMTDLGDNLPHGFLTPAGRSTSFAFWPPTMGVRKRLGAVAARKDLGPHPGKKIAYWLATALRELGGVVLDTAAGGKDLDVAALKVADLTPGDVLYLMLAWHRTSRPSGFSLAAAGCGSCGASFERVSVDLGTVEVDTLPPEASLQNAPIGRVGLIHGFPLAGKHCRTVAVRPPTWLDTFWRLSTDQWSNAEIVRFAMIEGGVVANDVVDLPRVPSAALDELMPEDADLIDGLLEKVTPSPQLRVEVVCPNCQRANTASIDWQDPDFFSGSSRA